jgi:c-di-GMP-binding flagellar brake protein YcgR
VNKSNLTAADDRRRFFRIDDEVNLFYKVVDEQEVLSASQVTNDLLSNCSLVTALDMLDQESRLVMYRIEKNDPEIAEYLKIQESKVSLIAQAVMTQGNDFSKGDMRNANISASGLAFECENLIKEGELLEIKLLLTSCLAVIVIYGKVIYCKETEKDETAMPYLIGVDYINMKEQDREVLIKHVVKRQMQQIRENKES